MLAGYKCSRLRLHQITLVEYVVAIMERHTSPTEIPVVCRLFLLWIIYKALWDHLWATEATVNVIAF